MQALKARLGRLRGSEISSRGDCRLPQTHVKEYTRSLHIASLQHASCLQQRPLLAVSSAHRSLVFDGLRLHTCFLLACLLHPGHVTSHSMCWGNCIRGRSQASFMRPAVRIACLLHPRIHMLLILHQRDVSAHVGQRSSQAGGQATCRLLRSAQMRLCCCQVLLLTVDVGTLGPQRCN